MVRKDSSMDSVVVGAPDWMRIVRLARRYERNELASKVLETKVVASSANFDDLAKGELCWVKKNRSDDLYIRYLASFSEYETLDEPNAPLEWAAKALGDLDRRERTDCLRSKDELIENVCLMCDEPVLGEEDVVEG